MGALPPPDPLPCPLGPSLSPCRLSLALCSLPVSSGQCLRWAAVMVRGMGGWPQQDAASAFTVVSFRKEFQNGGSSPHRTAWVCAALLLAGIRQPFLKLYKEV